MSPTLLVTGSLAYDRIAVFKGRFADHILKDHVHRLNVAFTVDDMEVNFGGTGGNIAYNLAQMGLKPILLGALGKDADDYLDHLRKQKINTAYLKKSAKQLTASATIMTDLADNQITSFYMGAMREARQLKMGGLKLKPSIAVIAANEKEAMLAYADYCFENEIPFIADPGQGIPAFSKKEMRELITGAHILIANDYEWELILSKTEWGTMDILTRINHLIVTYGDRGSRVWDQDGHWVDIPAYAAKTVDPTGCGDAYRAGLMVGYQMDFDVEKSAHIGSWVAARAVEKKGTQNHRISKSDFKKFLKSL